MKFLLRVLTVFGLATARFAHADATMPPALADLAAKVMPAVVSVASTDPVSGNSPDDQNDQNGQNDNGGGDDGGGDGSRYIATGALKALRAADTTSGTVIPPPKAEEALGSGFVIDPTGFIVTNNHVIDGATSVTVTFQDGTILPAVVVGRDKDGDLAVLKVDAGHPLPAVQFGDSTKLRVGDWVLAIGNPYGLPGSTSAGIVSALHRDIGENKYDDFIQTDATINRGNSGGPLFNLAGQVIGVNSAIYSPSGGSVGIGFAIPSSMVQPIAASLKSTGEIDRGWLGVSTEDVTPDIQKLLGLPDTPGALIAGVTKAGPADGKLLPGDVLVALNGVPITNPRSLTIGTSEIPAGQTAQAKFWRGAALRETALTVAVPPPDAPPGSAAPPVSADKDISLSSIGLAISADAPAMVLSIAQNGPAAKAGLAVNDTITAIGAQTVGSGTDLRDTLKSLARGGQAVAALLVEGDDSNGDNPGPRWVALPLN